MNKNTTPSNLFKLEGHGEEQGENVLLQESPELQLSLQVMNLNLTLSGTQILQNIAIELPKSGMTSLIGPSGAGKSSLLRCLTLLYDNWDGEVQLKGYDIRNWPGGADVLRQCVGLIHQKPAVFPCSIHDNVIFGLRGRQRKNRSADLVEQCLRQAALWDEVCDRLHEPANILSIGQQQRLCLARALALSPSVLLLDEPTASLDPRSKQLIEASLLKLAENMPVLCVTHDIEQARRLDGQVIFMCDGRVIETGNGKTFFEQPERLETREFLRWTVCDC
ncbi:MAG: ATP-binding cassette domain-containing protein [Mariprofundaceae bacterium]